MKKSMKVISLAMCLCITLGLFAGCGQSKSATSSSSDTSSSKASLRFMWWGSDSRHQATLAAIDKYHSLYPNVTITGEYGGYSGYQQKLSTQLASGTAPDIIQSDYLWMYDFASQKNLFVDLSKQKGMDLSKFPSTFLKSYCTVNNKLQGLPAGFGCCCVLYSKEAFKQYSISDSGTWTWDDFLKIGKQVHAQDPNKYFLLPGTDNARVLIQSYIEQKTGKALIDEKGNVTVDKATLTDAFSYFRSLLDNNVYEPFKKAAAFDTNPAQNPDWINGNIIADFDVASAYSTSQPNVKFTLGMIDYPVFKDAKAKIVHVSPSQLICVNSKSGNVNASVKFVNWFFNDKDSATTLSDTRGIPVNTTARQSLADANKINAQMSKVVDDMSKGNGVSQNVYSSNTEIVKIFSDTIQKVAYNNMSAADAANDMLSNYTQKVKEIKSST